MNDLRTWPMSLPGSKRKMIRKLWPNMPRPSDGHRFVLPFFGTGADAGYILDQGFRVAASDAQPLLIDWHRNAVACVDWARDQYVEIEAEQQSADDLGNLAYIDAGLDRFLKLRDEYNEKPEACRLWLLGKMAFGQLIRHNRSGKFNAHFGQLRALPTPARMEQHAAFIASLDSLEQSDFELKALSAEPGDVVYLDPPYFGTFDAYTAEPFDHARLVAVLFRLRARGIAWALSNSVAFVDVLLEAAPELRDEIKVHEVERGGSMNAKLDARQRVAEALIVWKPQT